MEQKVFAPGKLHYISLFLFCHIFFVTSHAQGFLKADGKRIVNAKGENVLLRGMGLGGWMLQEGYMLGIHKDAQQHNIRKRIEALMGRAETEEFYNAWLNNFVRKIDIDSMHAWGFNSVRLPMHYNLFTLPVDEEPVAGENTWLDRGFVLTDSLLAWCMANRMYLLLDLHAAPGGQGNDLNISDRDSSKPSLWQNEANQQKTIALWKKLAGRYKNEKWIGGYDILNEPN
ncbi:MAG: cellulase family glycosylhydrolase, partial [Ginsengibacter sp.]